MAKRRAIPAPTLQNTAVFPETLVNRRPSGGVDMNAQAAADVARQVLRARLEEVRLLVVRRRPDQALGILDRAIESLRHRP